MDSNDGSAADTHESALSEHQEKLLMRVVDNAAGPLLRYRARLLMKRNAAARSYVRSLQEVRAAVPPALAISSTPNLWDKIEARIENEERAALLLGKRAMTHQEEHFSFSHALFNRAFLERISWGMGGGVLAASATFLLVHSQVPGALQNTASNSLERAVAAHSRSAPVPVRLVSSGGLNEDTSSRFSTNSFNRDSIQVDWMRSSGRVNLIQDPGEHAPIIWVQRRQIPHFPSSMSRHHGTAMTARTRTSSTIPFSNQLAPR